jgi:hypothetical protein
MRHTLIPLKERILLRREYHTRAWIVLICVLAIAILAGSAAMFPAYLRAWSASRIALRTVASIRNDPNGSNLAHVQRVLASDDALLVALGSGAKVPRFSQAIASISAIHSPVTISSLTLNRMATSSVIVTMNGIAPTRNDLLKFKARLEGLAPKTNVDLPIEELAKSVNAPFSLQFVYNLP